MYQWYYGDGCIAIYSRLSIIGYPHRRQGRNRIRPQEQHDSKSSAEAKMKSLTASDIAEMPIQKRIQLVEEIWDSIAEQPDSVEIPQWHEEELDKRLQAHDANPSEGSPWKKVKRRILG